jgi:hypothetical protein
LELDMSDRPEDVLADVLVPDLEEIVTAPWGGAEQWGEWVVDDDGYQTRIW